MPLRLIPRTIRRVYHEDGGYFTTEVECEAESPIGIGVTGDTPPTPPGPPAPPPPPPPPPPPIPKPTGNAREKWFGTLNAIYWAGDYFNGGAPTFNKITSLPSGTPTGFNVASGGSAIYMATNTPAIYQCTSPKVGSPSWTPILSVGDAVASGYHVSSYFGYTFGPIMMSGTTLITTFHTDEPSIGWGYGAYDGSAWSFKRMPALNSFNPNGVGLDSWFFNASVYDSNSSLLETVTGDVESGANQRDIWHRAGGPRSFVYLVSSGPPHLRLHQVGGANTDLGAASAESLVTATHIRGAQSGPQTYVVAALDSPNSGSLFLSDDGTSFSQVGSAWGPGWVDDAALTGGGTLDWTLHSVTASNVPMRLYNRDGSVLRDMTGNLWSLTSGDQTIVGAGLVY